MAPKKAENFTLKDQFGSDFELYKNLDNNILLVFYPKDDSPVCSRQLDNYQANIHLFEKAGIQPVGINIESVDSHKSFCDMKNIKFPLLSDPGKEVSRRFSTLNFLSINKRKLVLINTSAEIVYERTTPSFLYTTAEKILEDIGIKHII